MKYIVFLLAWFILVIAAIAGWVTHVINCIQTESWFLLIVGAFAAPVGVIHGWCIWLGIF